MATVVTEGRAAAAPSLRRAMDAFLGDQLSAGDWLQWGHLATAAACMLWDCESWEMLSARHVELARASGALAPLFIALNGRGMFAAWSGDFEAAAALVAEEEAVKDVTGIQQASYGALLMAAYQGRAAEASALISASEADSADRGEGLGTQNAAMMKAILHNGLGHYAAALAAAELAVSGVELPNSTGWALPELIESAARSGKAELAREALRRLSMHTIRGADWAEGIEARCRALVTQGGDAERWYAEAVGPLARTPLRPELARAHLLYGEWLRREGRRVDAPAAEACVRHVRGNGSRRLHGTGPQRAAGHRREGPQTGSRSAE